MQPTTQSEAKIMEFLAVAIMLLFTAFLFLGYSMPASSTPTTIHSLSLFSANNY